MTKGSRLEISAKLDRTLAWYRGNSVRHAVVSVTAYGGDIAKKSSHALNLGIVIDASGSMGGEKLEHAKLAARGVVGSLGPQDTLSIVSFSDDVIVHLGSTLCDTEGKRHALAAIDPIETRGLTNLSEGWFTGAEQVAGAARQGAISRLVLLSDGMANAGITQREALGAHAAELHSRGISTSCVGIGDDYDPTLLQVIATHGGGRMHDAEAAHEIVEVLIGELRETQSTSASNVELKLVLPPGIRASVVGFATSAVREGELTAHLGSLIDGIARRVVVRLSLPSGDPGSVLSCAAHVNGRVPGTGTTLSAGPAPFAITLAHGTENDRQPQDIEQAVLVAQAWHAVIVNQVAQLNRSGDRRQARHYLERELKYFERYARDLPGGAEQTRSLVLMLEKVGDDWNERTRKEMMFASYSLAESRTDHRLTEKESWASRLSRS